MKFSDIDFSAISQMMNNMSDEEKESLNDMANNMMNNMQQAQEPEDEIDMYEFLHIDEESYSSLNVLDRIEAAVDFEQFYDEDIDQDYSASVLFYAKAVIELLREKHFPIYKNVLKINDFNNPATTTIYSFLYPLMNDENIHQLVDEDFGNTQDWTAHKNFLQQLYVLLQRAEYDSIHYDELQGLKKTLFEDQSLLRINELI